MSVIIAAYLVYGVVLSKHNMESIDGVQNEFILFINMNYTTCIILILKTLQFFIPETTISIID